MGGWLLFKRNDLIRKFDFLIFFFSNSHIMLQYFVFNLMNKLNAYNLIIIFSCFIHFFNSQLIWFFVRRRKRNNETKRKENINMFFLWHKERHSTIFGGIGSTVWMRIYLWLCFSHESDYVAELKTAKLSKFTVEYSC